MATTVIDSGGGDDYTSISAWEAATDNDLVTAAEGEIGEIQGTTYAENTTIAGATTNATYYRTLRAQSGHRHDGTSGGGGVVIDPSSNGHAFQVEEDHFRAEYLRITGLQGTSDECFRILATGVYVSHCVMHDLNTSQQDGIYFGFNDSNTRTIYVRNCVIYDVDRSGVNVQKVSNKTVYVHNCTFYNCGSGGNTADASISDDGSSPNNCTVNAVNCTSSTPAEAGSNAGFYAAYMTLNVTNCATEYSSITIDGATDGGNNVTSVVQADQFVSLTGGSEDFNVQDTAADIYQAGADLDSDANLPVTDDIVGTARHATTPDIGAFEFTSGATTHSGITSQAFSASQSADGDTTLGATASQAVSLSQTAAGDIPGGTQSGVTSQALTAAQTLTGSALRDATAAQSLVVTQTSAGDVTSIRSKGLLFPGAEDPSQWSEPSPIVRGSVRFNFKGGVLPDPFPCTLIWRCYPQQQNGYYVTWFRAVDTGDANWDWTDWSTAGGSTHNYSGTPYPTDGANGTDQEWSIASDSADTTDGDNVEWDRWFVQAFTAEDLGGGSKRFTFYWDLVAGTGAAHTVNQDRASYFEPTYPTDSALIFGDAAWADEGFKGIIRGIQIYQDLLTVQEILDEVDDPLSTAAGAANIFYLNLDPTPTDISDQSGNGNDPSWVGANRPTLYTAHVATVSMGLVLTQAASATVGTVHAGVVAQSLALTQTSDSDVLASGTASQTATLSQTVNADVTTGATTAQSVALSQTANADLLAGAVAAQAIAATQTADGDLLASATVAQSVSVSQTAAGDVSGALSGVTTQALAISQTATAGALREGVASQAVSVTQTADADLLASATVAHTASMGQVADGTLIEPGGTTHSGIAAQALGVTQATSAGVLRAGAGTQATAIAQTASGGAVRSGVADTGLSLTQSTTGGALRGASWAVSSSVAQVSTGQRTLGGAANQAHNVGQTSAANIIRSGSLSIGLVLTQTAQELSTIVAAEVVRFASATTLRTLRAEAITMRTLRTEEVQR